MGPKTTVDSLLLTQKLLFPENFPTPLFPEGEVNQESTVDLQHFLTQKLLFPENFPTPLFPEGEVSQESTDDLQRCYRYRYVKFLKIGGHYHTAPQAVMKRNMKLQPLIEP